MREKPRKILFYTDLKYSADNNGLCMMPIVKDHLDKISHQERIREYKARVNSFKIVQSVEKADWFVLPSAWEHYIKNNSIYKAIDFAKKAKQYGKLILIWGEGDRENIIPIDNAIFIQSGLHHNLPNRKPLFTFERPAPIKDYIEIYMKGNWFPSKKYDNPIVGFCGFAKQTTENYIRFTLRNIYEKTNYWLKRSNIVPQMHGCPVALRAKTLQLLKKSERVKTNFIIRDNFGAGITKLPFKQRMFHKSKLEFVNNIMGSMYVLCIRGGGNFSIRFYETLCCGRIPIVINTDSMFPFQEFVEWDKYIVKIDIADINRIGDIVNDFHNSLSAVNFEELQLQCRSLWENLLSFPGYYSNFYKYLKITANY